MTEKRYRVTLDFEYGSKVDFEKVINQLKLNFKTGELSERMLLPGGIYNFEKELIEDREMRTELINGRECLVIMSRM